MTSVTRELSSFHFSTLLPLWLDIRSYWIYCQLDLVRHHTEESKLPGINRAFHQVKMAFLFQVLNWLGVNTLAIWLSKVPSAVSND